MLKYSELLVNKPTEPGTHTLKVNESAVLHPIDGNGVAGEAYEFPVPTVDYTVAKPDPALQPGATDKPSDNRAATDKPGAKTALAKTGDEAFAIGMGCLLVAGRKRLRDRHRPEASSQLRALSGSHPRMNPRRKQERHH